LTNPEILRVVDETRFCEIEIPSIRTIPLYIRVHTSTNDDCGFNNIVISTFTEQNRIT